METTTTFNLSDAADELTNAIYAYNKCRARFHLLPICRHQMVQVDLALGAGADLVDPLGRLVNEAGSADWDEHNPIVLRVRRAWLLSIVALHEDGDDAAKLLDQVSFAPEFQPFSI